MDDLEISIFFEMPFYYILQKNKIYTHLQDNPKKCLFPYNFFSSPRSPPEKTKN